MTYRELVNTWRDLLFEEAQREPWQNLAGTWRDQMLPLAAALLRCRWAHRDRDPRTARASLVRANLHLVLIAFVAGSIEVRLLDLFRLQAHVVTQAERVHSQLLVPLSGRSSFDVVLTHLIRVLSEADSNPHSVNALQRRAAAAANAMLYMAVDLELLSEGSPGTRGPTRSLSAQASKGVDR